MRPTGSRGLLLITVGWAAIGLLLGHVAAYSLVYPDDHVHAAALAESGHGWLSLLEPSLVVAMVLVLVGAWLAARAHRPREVRFRLLVGIQVTAFVVMELGERILAGYTPLDLWHTLVDHGLWLILGVGIVAQVITARFGSAASRGIAAATTARGEPPRRSRRGPRIALGDQTPRPHRPASHRRCRAPPWPLARSI